MCLFWGGCSILDLRVCISDCLFCFQYLNFIDIQILIPISCILQMLNPAYANLDLVYVISACALCICMFDLVASIFDCGFRILFLSLEFDLHSLIHWLGG